MYVASGNRARKKIFAKINLSRRDILIGTKGFTNNISNLSSSNQWQDELSARKQEFFLKCKIPLCLLDRASLWWLKNKRPTWCHSILFHFLCAQHVSDINISIIRSLWLFCWITTLVVLFLVRCVLEIRSGIRVAGWSTSCASACNTDTTTTHILMSETCWAHKKWNKIASDIKLVKCPIFQ